MAFRKQWPERDVDFFIQLVTLHNEIMLNKKEENEFDQFVLENKSRFNNPDYLEIFVERINIKKEYFKEHEEVCRFFFDFMKKNPDWKKLNFGFRTHTRLNKFEELFKEYIESKP